MLTNPVTPSGRVFSPQKPSRQLFNRYKENTEKTAVQLKRKWSDELLLREAIQAQIDPDSPVKKEGTPDNSPNKSAYSVYTNSGAKLEKTFETKNFTVYSHHGNLRNEFSGAELRRIINTLFQGVDSIPDLPPIEPDSKKIQTATITEKKRKKANKKPYRNQSVAITDDNGQVRANKDIADIYFTKENLDRVAKELVFNEEQTARLEKQFLNMQAEWLHLVDYANIGEKGQCSKNLVFGTWEANSQMNVIEQFIERILKKNLTAEVTVKASICKLHIAYEINYELIISETKSRIEIPFNPFTREKPLKELIQYLGEVENKLAEKQSIQNPLLKKNLFTLFGGEPDSDPMDVDALPNGSFHDPDLFPIKKKKI